METEREVMKRLFTATLLLFFLQGSSQIISAQTAKVKSLRGLWGVGVLIEDLHPNAKKAGLTKSQLQTDVEVELRKAGIPVLTEDERLKTPGRPVLYVNVNSIDSSEGFYVYNIKVDLRQLVDLRRNRSIGNFATTWNREHVAGVGKSYFKQDVREKVRDYVNIFINDYLTVNPK